jgi:hypothetical protein
MAPCSPAGITVALEECAASIYRVCMFTVNMEEARSSKTLLIPLRCPQGFDENQLELEMCEEALGGGK